MRPSTLFLLIASIVAFLGGFVFFAWYHNFIIIKTSFKSYTLENSELAERKTVTLFTYRADRWHSEQKELLWSSQLHKAITSLVTSWLLYLEEEQNTAKKVTLQSVVLSPSEQELYVSFDRNPLNKESSTFEKLMWVESLLKTLRENDIKVHSVYLLVHHQPLHDYHLDFSRAWPITGFVSVKA